MFEHETTPDRDRTTGRVRAPEPPPQVFAKLEIGAVDSPFEREADAIAGEVMRKIDGQAGHDGDVMGRMEHAFGADFSGVRLHTDREAADMSAGIQARAFTHGSDIYFGEGQFRPDTRSGQQLLAHELTHTIQQTGAAPHADADVARRSPLPSVSRDSEGQVRRWALDGGVDLTKITALRTAGTAQQTFFAKDASGREIMVKPGSVSMSLLQLADVIHVKVHDTDYIKSFELDDTQKGVLAGKIRNAAVSADGSWTQSGQQTRGALLPGEDDAAKARRLFAEMVENTTAPLTAQMVVDGKNAKKLSRDQGQGHNSTGSAMRDRFESPRFMRSLGHAALTDAFTGNADRLANINLGNFMSTGSDNVTLIDNMDKMGAADSFLAEMYDDEKDENVWNERNWIPDELRDFGKDPRATVERVIDNVVRDLGYEGEDATSLKAWIDQPGTNRRQFMVQDMLAGVEEAKAAIVATFSKDKKKSAGRAAKAAIQGIAQDDEQVDFWEMMKARAMVLRNPSKADKMIARLKRRHTRAQKKKAKQARRRG